MCRSYIPYRRLYRDRRISISEEALGAFGKSQTYSKSGGLLAGIHGLFSGRNCCLVKRITCGYPWPELEGKRFDLEVAFWKSTCYIRDLNGNDLLTGSRGTYLYSITLQETSTPNPICLMAKATSSQAWLWQRRLSHLNFDTINLLLKNNIVESINRKKYVLVIVDDYSRYTWTYFWRSKDETPAVLIDFLTLVQRGLHAQVRTVQTDKAIHLYQQQVFSATQQHPTKLAL
ncbi:retrovirus-related pol polyprotein from transposon TNT 1-94 [Tanacetum coccineum]